MTIISHPPRGMAALVERTNSYLSGFTGRSLKELLWSKFCRYDMAALRNRSIMSDAERETMLGMRDLTDPAAGPHAMQELLKHVIYSVENRYGVKTTLYRSPTIIGENENYIRLGFDESALARDAKYAYRIDEQKMLRSHLSGTAPELLKKLHSQAQTLDTVFVMPGIAYRRDTVDRYHAAGLHQSDFWHIRQGKNFTRKEMRQFVAAIIEAACPGRRWRWNPTSHPYTRAGRQVDVWYDNHWVEVGECGIVANDLLAREGLNANQWSGMLFGIGLDRCLMIHKNMPDIRLLRATSSTVAEQLLDLQPWRPLHGASKVEVFDVLVLADEDGDTLGDRSRQALGALAPYLENLEIVARVVPQRGDQTMQTGEAVLKLRATFSSLHGELPREVTDQAMQLLRHGLNLRLTYEPHNVLQSVSN